MERHKTDVQEEEERREGPVELGKAHIQSEMAGYWRAVLVCGDRKKGRVIPTSIVTIIAKVLRPLTMIKMTFKDSSDSQPRSFRLPGGGC